MFLFLLFLEIGTRQKAPGHVRLRKSYFPLSAGKASGIRVDGLLNPVPLKMEVARSDREMGCNTQTVA